MASEFQLASYQYETVAASQTGQIMGGGGAKGDLLDRVVIVPETTSPGAVTIIDGTTSIIIFVGGASSVAALTPMIVNLGTNSVSGPWSITTGAAVHVMCIGRFT